MIRYNQKCEELKIECLKRRKEIIEKYKNEPLKEGLYANYKMNHELREVSHWVQNEINILYKKNNFYS